jgi:hypothetical protein
MRSLCRYLMLIILVMLPLSAALAAPVSWTDWTTASTSEVTGVLAFGSDTVDVSFQGEYLFAQVSGGGTNYWIPSAPYISSSVDNAPPDSDIIALGSGGSVTITFSQAVQDPLLALVSWNGNTVDFGVPINILSYGAGYWGNGIPILNGPGTGFFGSGEVHGVIELPGLYDSITFTHTSEGWHGLTVGARAVVIPLPPTVWFFGSGLVGLIGLRSFFRRS